MAEPSPTKEPGQRSINEPYLVRYIPMFRSPDWAKAEAWRAFVRNQPIAMACREALVSSLEALDWKISARDSNKRDELQSEIDYYTKFLENNNGLDFSEHLEWICQDLLDLPFGAATEVGREGDKPEGKVLWIELIDGGTLYPTMNKDYPVGQKVNGIPTPVIFPEYAINRIYLSPRTEMKRRGWGMAPPEKIYLAMELRNRGDSYYANLLLDSPTAGVLDLGDMEKESAEEWLTAFRSLLGGLDPFKIPVLYEHTSQTKFIPFGKLPNDIMYDRITTMYASLICSGYGVTLGDIGFSESSNGGNTMAGTIRQERSSKRRGYSVIKKKTKYYFDRLIPESLQFNWIDFDDELNVAIGRARLANATAFGQMIDKGYISKAEARLQTIADGMMTISMPEDIPPDAQEKEQKPIERPGMLGSPVPPSAGGYGEVKKAIHHDIFKNQISSFLELVTDRMDSRRLGKLIVIAMSSVFPHVKIAATNLKSEAEFETWKSWSDKVLYEERSGDDYFDASVEMLRTEVEKKIEEDKEDDWWLVPTILMSPVFMSLRSAYEEELRSVISEVVNDLYRSGEISNPNLDASIIVELKNKFVLEELEKRSDKIKEYINSGTLYFLVRTLISETRNYLSSPSVRNRILSGVDLETILSDNTVMQSLSQDISDKITKIMASRAEVYTQNELWGIRSQVRLDMFTRLGLTKKLWKHRGSDVPCPYCVANETAGWVELSYKYDSQNGRIEYPPAHQHEHCDIIYDRNELNTLSKNNNFKIWNGD